MSLPESSLRQHTGLEKENKNPSEHGGDHGHTASPCQQHIPPGIIRSKGPQQGARDGMQLLLFIQQGKSQRIFLADRHQLKCLKRHLRDPLRFFAGLGFRGDAFFGAGFVVGG